MLGAMTTVKLCTSHCLFDKGRLALFSHEGTLLRLQLQPLRRCSRRQNSFLNGSSLHLGILPFHSECARES